MSIIDLQTSKQIREAYSVLDELLRKGALIIERVADRLTQVESAVVDEINMLNQMNGNRTNAYTTDMANLNEWHNEVLNALKNLKIDTYLKVKYRFDNHEAKHVAQIHNFQFYERKLYALTEILQIIADRHSLVIRREISESEMRRNIKFELKLNIAGDLLLNEFKLATVRHGSDNDIAIRYFLEKAAASPFKIIEVTSAELNERFFDELDHVHKVPQFKDILTQLNFKGDLRNIFFPGGASKKSIKFINPISLEYFRENKLPELKY